MKVGQAKYTTGKKSNKIEKDKENVYRILPPVGKLADTGKWFQYYRVEWGYKNSKDQHRPFLDCRVVNFKTKMVEVESAAHVTREAVTKKKETMLDSLKELKKTNPKATFTEEQVKTLEQIKVFSKRFNLDAKYYVNAVNLAGEITLLKMNSKHYKALRVEIDKFTKAGIDPLSLDNGRFFSFTKTNETGNLQDWHFSVSPYQENIEATVNGQTTVLLQNKVHVMDETFLTRLEGEAWELSDMYPELTAEQVQRVVSEGVPAIDELLGFREDVTSTTEDAKKSEEDAKQDPAVTAPTPTPEVAAPTQEVTTPAVTAPTPDPTTGSPVITPTPTEAAVTAPTSTTKTPTPTPAEEQEANDAFLKGIGAIK